MYLLKAYRCLLSGLKKIFTILKWYCIFYAVMSALFLNFPKTTGALVDAADMYLSPEAYVEELETI